MCTRRVPVLLLPEVLWSVGVLGAVRVLLLLRVLQDVRAVHLRLLPRVRASDAVSYRTGSPSMGCGSPSGEGSDVSPGPVRFAGTPVLPRPQEGSCLPPSLSPGPVLGTGRALLPNPLPSSWCTNRLLVLRRRGDTEGLPPFGQCDLFNTFFVLPLALPGAEARDLPSPGL